MLKRNPDPAIKYVLINGKIVCENGEISKVLGIKKLGKILTQKNKTSSSQEALDSYRNRIKDGINFKSNTSYWDVFLLKHQTVPNVCIHCIAFIIMYSIVAASILYNRILLFAVLCYHYTISAFISIP